MSKEVKSSEDLRPPRTTKSELDRVKKMEVVKLGVGVQDEFFKVMHEICEDRYCQLEGRLMGTLEILLPNGEILKALKDRVKGVQGEIWEDIHQEYSSLLLSYFSARETTDSNSIEADEETRKTHIQDFVKRVRWRIRENLKYYTNVVTDLVGVAIGDSGKFPFIKREVNRLISSSRAKMISYVGRELASVLK